MLFSPLNDPINAVKPQLSENTNILRPPYAICNIYIYIYNIEYEYVIPVRRIRLFSCGSLPILQALFHSASVSNQFRLGCPPKLEICFAIFRSVYLKYSCN